MPSTLQSQSPRSAFGSVKTRMNAPTPYALISPTLVSFNRFNPEYEHYSPGHRIMTPGLEIGEKARGTVMR